jgi:hypothetical protein
MAAVYAEVGRRVALGEPLDDLVDELNSLFRDMNRLKLDGVEPMTPIAANDLRAWFAGLSIEDASQWEMDS